MNADVSAETSTEHDRLWRCPPSDSVRAFCGNLVTSGCSTRITGLGLFGRGKAQETCHKWEAKTGKIDFPCSVNGHLDMQQRGLLWAISKRVCPAIMNRWSGRCGCCARGSRPSSARTSLRTSTTGCRLENAEGGPLVGLRRWLGLMISRGLKTWNSDICATF